MQGLRWSGLFVALLLMTAACGSKDKDDPGLDGAGGSAGRGGAGGGAGSGGEGGEGGSDEEKVIRDTSGYEGRLAWTTGPRHGLHVWDLPSSEMIFTRAGEGVDALPGDPILSADGRLLTYTVYESYFLTAFFTSVRRLDLETGGEILYPTDDLSEDEVRNTSHPSMSRDGKRIAVIETTTVMEGDMAISTSEPAIEVWDVETDQRIRVTSGAEKDRAPILDGDGQTIFFLSDRDSRDLDIYRAPVEPDAPVTRLTVFSHPDVERIELLYEPPAISADGKWLVFLGRLTENGTGAFLMDVTTGAIERIGDSSRVTGVSISADGSLVGWNLLRTEEEPPTFEQQAWVAPTNNLEDAVMISDDATMSAIVALSGDGSQVAFVTQMRTLMVAKADGSDPRIVSGEEEDLVVPLMGMSLCF